MNTSLSHRDVPNEIVKQFNEMCEQELECQRLKNLLMQDLSVFLYKNNLKYNESYGIDKLLEYHTQFKKQTTNINSIKSNIWYGLVQHEIN